MRCCHGSVDHEVLLLRCSPQDVAMKELTMGCCYLDVNYEVLSFSC